MRMRRRTYLRSLGVRGIPAMYLFRGGSILAQTAGAMSADAIVRWVHNHLGS